MLGGPVLPALGHAFAGATGAAISNLGTYPLALIITRLQIQKQLRSHKTVDSSEDYTSIQDAASKIYSQEGGLRGLYAGLTSDTFKTVADSFLFFLAYNFLRQSRIRSRRDRSKHLPVLDELSVGFLAGAFSKFLTTPIANIVTRKQARSMMNRQAVPRPGMDSSSTSSIALQIRSEKGLLGFWSGYSASLVLTLNPSLTFFFYETLKRVLTSRAQTSTAPAPATFFMAATSKAMASTITYPFALAKTRAQTSTPSVGGSIHLDSKETSSNASTATHSRPRRSNNVFAIILDIVRTNGISSLYEGLPGEIWKGFFSHGITMSIKDVVHKCIIHLYYMILRLLDKYPDAQALREKTRASAAGLSNIAAENTMAAAETAKAQMLSTAQEGQAVMKKMIP